MRGYINQKESSEITRADSTDYTKNQVRLHRDATGHRRILSGFFRDITEGNDRLRALCILLQKELILVTCAIITKGVIKFSHAIPLSVMIIGLSEVQLGLLS